MNSVCCSLCFYKLLSKILAKYRINGIVKIIVAWGFKALFTVYQKLDGYLGMRNCNSLNECGRTENAV